MACAVLSVSHHELGLGETPLRHTSTPRCSSTIACAVSAGPRPGPQLPGRMAGRLQRGALFPCPGPLPRSTKKRRGKGLGCARLGLVAAVAAAARPRGLAWGRGGAWQQGAWQHASVWAGSRGLSVSAGCVGTVPPVGAHQRRVMLVSIQSQGPGAAQG